MKFILRTTGGQGLRLEGELDSADLPEDLAQHIEEVLTLEHLNEAAQVPANTRMVDALLYELIVIPDDIDEEALEQETFEQTISEQETVEQESSEQAVLKFEFSEAQDIPEILDILDEMMREIIRRKLERRKENRENKEEESS